jgi:hypothetical protein
MRILFSEDKIPWVGKKNDLKKKKNLATMLLVVVFRNKGDILSKL